MLLIFLRQNPSASPASFKTLPKAYGLNYLARLNVHWKKYLEYLKYLEYRFLMLSYKNIYLWYTKYVLIGTPLFWGGNHPSY